MNVVTKYFIAFTVIFLLVSNSADPPNGRTGAPGDGMCSDCHSGNNFTGNVSLTGLPDEVISGEQYEITVSVNNTDGNAVRAGFQMTSLFNGEFIKAGELLAPANDVGIVSSGGRQYIEHRGAKNFENEVAEWIVQWQAPEVMEEEEVVVFLAGNITNGNQSSSGDAAKFTDQLTLVKPLVMDSLAVEILVEDIPCFAAFGSLEAIVTGGVMPYTYDWSNGVVTATNEVLGAGFYEVTVTDSEGSTATAEVLLDEPDPIVITSVINDVQLGDSLSGSVSVEVQGGSPPYFYQWSNGQMTSAIDSLPAGEYTLTVTDANLCTQTITLTIADPACIFSINLEYANVSCFGSSDGEAFIDPQNFEQPLSFQWSNGDNSFIAVAGLAAGDYSVTVEDGTGCTIIETFTIEEPAPLALEASIEFLDCNNPEVNAISANVSGGTGIYQFLWSNDSTSATIVNQQDGFYSVTVTDENGCEVVEDEILLSYVDTIPPTISFVDSVTLFVDADGELDLSPMELEESDPCGISSAVLSGDVSCSNLDERMLSYEVTDANGNIAVANIFIMGVIDTFAPGVVCPPNLIQEGCDTIFYEIPLFTDNCRVDSMVLVEGLPSGSVFPKGSTVVTYDAYDAAGNLSTCSFTIETDHDLVITVDEVQNVGNQTIGFINITVEGGSGDYSFEWFFNDTTLISTEEDISDLVPGSYFVKVSDMQGCSISSENIVIEMESSIEKIVPAPFQFFPNPVDEVVYIESNVEIEKIQLYDLNGRLIQSINCQMKTSPMKVNVSTLSEGIYLAKIQSLEDVWTHKFYKR